MKVLDRVKSSLADVLGMDVEDIEVSTSPDNTVAWDSVAHLNLILALESEFSLEFSSEEIGRAMSVGNMVDIIEAKL